MDRIGQQLGNYRLLHLLGSGGFAEVYLGQHVFLNTHAAIKVLHARLSKEDTADFLTEARTIASLQHPNIVRVLDFGLDGDMPFLVMDYAPNGTLRQRYPRGTKLQPLTVLPYVQQICAALQYAHDMKLIHRDIKPENMLLGQRGNVLLSDFGIALMAHSSHSQSTQDVTGTISYMSPEQIQGKPRLASDQYSLGVVVYEWLSGEPLFRGSFTEIATQHIFTVPPQLNEKVLDVSAEVARVVQIALAKDPHQRFASVQAFANAFGVACHSQPSTQAMHSSPLSPPLTPYVPPPQATVTMTPSTHTESSSMPPEGTVPIFTDPINSERATSRQFSTPDTEHANFHEGVFFPQPQKKPKTLYMVGTIALLIFLIGGGYWLFAPKAGSNATNTGSSQSGNQRNNGGNTPIAPARTTTVALVTDIGGLNDNGFNHLAYLGYSKAQQQYGFTSNIIQTVSQNDYVKNLTYAAQHANLVIAVGFLMQTPLDQVARQFPNTHFAIVDGCPVPNPNTGACETLPNVAPLFFKEQEAGCLVGAIAGQMEVDGKSKVPNLLGHNTIAAVGGLAIPPVIRYIAGYKYCAQKVDPSINVVISYSNDFATAAKCQNVAQSQISQQQADIIFQVAGGCGIGALDAAYQSNVYGIGVDADQGYVHPNVITSALKRVDTAVYDIIKDTEGGSYTNTPPTFGVTLNGVGYAPVSSAVPQDATATADAFANQIIAGTLVPPETIP